MSFSFSKPNKEYRDAILSLIDVIYDVTLTYFIHKSPKQLVEELKDEKYFDHKMLIDKCIEIINKYPVKYNLSNFKKPLPDIISELYYCIFGQDAQDLNNFIYLKKGKGWCERYFPPSDNEMYTFIVDQITRETKHQFLNPIKL